MDHWQIQELIINALKEDMPFGDQTTELLIPEGILGRAFFLAKEDLVVCGQPVVEAVFKLLDQDVKVEWTVPEGEEVKAGTKFGYVTGTVRSLLQGERVSLNFLQHLSGIATKVRRMTKKIEGTKTLLLDTRKTLPGLKVLQKYAVRVGGGTNHRFSLSDGILIKDNHIKALGGLKQVLEKLKRSPTLLKVEIEVKTFEELLIVLQSDAQVDIVMLDNFSYEDIKRALELIRVYKPQIKVEISGGIREDNIEQFAELGVDFISSGAITHSVKAVDISMKIERVWERGD